MKIWETLAMSEGGWGLEKTEAFLCRIPVVGSCLSMSNKAPHPNAAPLFLEWIQSPQGLIFFEEVTMKGAVFPGTGTRQARALEGLKLVVMTEDVTKKVMELGLDERFAKILDVTPGH